MHAKQPSQRAREERKTDETARRETPDHDQIECCDRANDVLILTEQQEHEAARHPRQDPGADRDRARSEGHSWMLRCREAASVAHGRTDDQPCKRKGQPNGVPDANRTRNECGRRADQTEEEGPKPDFVVLKQPGHDAREADDGDPHPHRERQQKAGVHVTPRKRYLKPRRIGQELPVEAVEGLHQL